MCGVSDGGLGAPGCVRMAADGGEGAHDPRSQDRAHPPHNPRATWPDRDGALQATRTSC
jgi:hypothetical protein